MTLKLPASHEYQASLLKNIQLRVVRGGGVCVYITLPARGIAWEKDCLCCNLSNLNFELWQYYISCRRISPRTIMKYDRPTVLIDTASGNTLCHVNKNLPSIK